MIGIPWLTNCGPMVCTDSVATFVLKRDYRYLLELPYNSSRVIWLLVDGKIESLVNILSMGALNSLDSLKFGAVVCHIFPMIPFRMQPEGGVGLQLPTSLIPLLLGAGLVPSIPVLIALTEILLAPVLYIVVTVMTSSSVSVFIACGACTTPVLIVKSDSFFASIISYVGGANTGSSSCLIPIFRLLKNIW